MLQVIVSYGDEVLARATFRDTVVTVGRGEDNTIQVEHASLSRHHARIEPQGRGWIIRDLQSTNGVLKDGQRVSEWAINDGDEVLLGEYLLSFAVEEEQEAPEAPEPPAAPPALPKDLAELAVLGATFCGPSSPELDQPARERSSHLRAHLLDGEGRCWVIDRDAFVVGARADADLPLRGLLAPRVGAVIVRGYGGFSVVNVSGRGGWVRVEDQPVARSAHLAARAHLRLGPCALRFMIGPPPADVAVTPQTSRARRP